MGKRSFPYTVITCADANFFHFLPALERNIERKLGILPVIYDLGMTAEQRASLASKVRSVPVPEAFGGAHPEHGFVMATHKPACITDALDCNPVGCLYADADTFLTAPVSAAELGDADVAVTPRHPRERTPHHLVNGDLNSGVLFFSGRPPARALLAAWAEACAEGQRTDQQALSDLLAPFDLLAGPEELARDGLRLRKLDARIYNDVGLRTGKILHFKNAGRTPKVTRKLERIRDLEARHPLLLTALFRLRRFGIR
ncbi:hypothetical protein [Rhodobacteraceae bacterium DSL-40]|uniref:hypothetical protein n=1 Tax=Amaricoccus sp. B4 TaxID=3368557 RepID=UPI000DAD4535